MNKKHKAPKQAVPSTIEEDSTLALARKVRGLSGTTSKTSPSSEDGTRPYLTPGITSFQDIQDPSLSKTGTQVSQAPLHELQLDNLRLKINEEHKGAITNLETSIRLDVAGCRTLIGDEIGKVNRRISTLYSVYTLGALGIIATILGVTIVSCRNEVSEIKKTVPDQVELQFNRLEKEKRQKDDKKNQESDSKPKQIKKNSVDK